MSDQCLGKRGTAWEWLYGKSWAEAVTIYEAMASGEEKDSYFFPVCKSFYVTFLDNAHNLSYHCTKVIKTPQTNTAILEKKGNYGSKAQDTSLSPFRYLCSLASHCCSCTCLYFFVLCPLQGGVCAHLPFSVETTVIGSITVATLRYYFCYEKRMLTKGDYLWRHFFILSRALATDDQN